MEVVSNLQLSPKCILPLPFNLLAQFNNNVGRLNFVCNMLRPFLLSTSNVLILVMPSLVYLLRSNSVLYFLFTI